MYQMLIAMMASNKSKKGQGVIEYAGALVIAAAIVAGVLLIGPQGLSDLFTTILDTVTANFTAALNQ
ncbi:hypothetical protein [Vampirovibrio chlorellavorus]|uniref:hypothetical protein n=1 Tax=Vampirovibrio chlorellavorus TaxID=758823 RepID=UPI0026EFB2D2|nr:hypothetical protein [Vampirovibrio chlorellavorus]